MKDAKIVPCEFRKFNIYQGISLSYVIFDNVGGVTCYETIYHVISIIPDAESTNHCITVNFINDNHVLDCLHISLDNVDDISLKYDDGIINLSEMFGFDYVFDEDYIKLMERERAFNESKFSWC